MPPILYLIDGHALAYRTYFALMSSGGSRFQTSSGEPTAGTFGFASALLRLLEQDRPEYLAVAFDTGKTFRNELFPAYKATRAKMPEDLRPQITRIRQMVDTFKIPRLEMEGFEADDVLGSIARQASSQGFGVKIITGDRDLLQLVDDRIIVNLAGRKISEAKDYTAKDVVSLLGIRPEQVVDYKALVGDPSDNIPGVYGIGKKTAAMLFDQYSSLDEIYEHLGEFPIRIRKKLENGQKSAYLSQELAAICTDVKITLDLETALTSKMDLAAVETLFNELEFTTLIRRLRSLAQPSVMTSEKQQLSLFGEEVASVGFASDYQTSVLLVNDLEGLKKLQEKLASSPRISLDTETTSIEPMRAKLVGISLATQAGEGYYIPTGHQTGDPQLPEELVIDALRPFLTNGDKKIIGHNLKYDGLVLTRCGLKPSSYEFDTMIAEWLIEPSSHRLGLKDMADRYLHVTMSRIDDLIGKCKNQLSMADVPVDKVAPYAAADADIPIQLQPFLQNRLEEQNALNLFKDVEMPLIPILADMEETGISLDIPFFEQMSAELLERTGEIKTKVFESIGYEFNLNSTQQLSKVLFETLRLEPPPGTKKTASG
ncbi:MAG: hypothetical protein MUO76_03170, partial [Anaerolineaceae bacterium]|nr:hypothetical protein [Anaerolineaceae bacterium]